MKVGILGGTFDPVHQGHIAIAKTALRQLALSKVLFIPTRQSHEKPEDGHGASPEHRFEMVRLAIKGSEQFDVSRVEIDREGVSYTVETLRELTRRYPENRWVLIMGADTYRGFKNWKESAKIQEMASLAIAGRAREQAQGDGDQIERLEMEDVLISSTEIRRQIEQGKDPGSRILSREVYRYIREHQLYTGARAW